MTPEDIANRFEYHAPTTEEKRNNHTSIREACRTAADCVNATCPEGREKSLAVTHLEEAMFWANAALARNNG